VIVTKLFCDDPAINLLQLQIAKIFYHLKFKSMEEYSRRTSKASKICSFKMMLDKLVLLII